MTTDLTYTTPSNGLGLAPLGSTVDTFNYTVTDIYGDLATGTVNVTVTDPAIANNGSLTVGYQKTINITSLVDSLFPATETLTGVSSVDGSVQLLPGGNVTYSAPSGGDDTISYTVVDQYGNTATGDIAVTVDALPIAGNVTAAVNLGQPPI